MFGVLLLAVPAVRLSVIPAIEDVVDEALASTEVDYRLPKEIVPIHYELFLNFTNDHTVYSGSVRILFEVTKPVSSIKIHSKGLKILTHRVKSTVDGSIILISKHNYMESPEFWILEMSQQIPAGKYEISMEFQPETGYGLDDKHDAFEGDIESMINSRQAPTYVRRLFPCFDEPQFKATFNLIVQFEKKFKHYFFASAVKTIRKIDGHEFIEFEKTLPMSTSQFGIVATDYERKFIDVPQMGYGIPFVLSMYVKEEFVNSTDFYLLFAKEFMEQMVEYTGVPYYLPHMDLVSQVYSFYDGVETMGLATIKPDCITTYDNFKMSSRGTAVSKLATKLATMWFGNLVTMKWWSDMNFLKAFPMFLSYKVLHKMRPTWADVPWYFHAEMADALTSEYQSPNMISPTTELSYHTLFNLPNKDTIMKSYGLLQMVQDSMNSFNFQKAISMLLEKNEFGVVSVSDFGAELDFICPEGKLSKFIETWTTTYGFPLVTVEEVAKGKYSLTQKPYTSDSDYKDMKYFIPISSIGDKALTHKIQELWFESSLPTFTFEEPELKWIMFNTKQDMYRVGYYRVNYTEALWHKFASLLKEDYTVMSYYSRVNLIEDAWALVQNEDLRMDVMMELLQFLEFEDNPKVWQVAFKPMEYLYDNLIGESFIGYKKFASKLMKKFYTYINWEKNPFIIEDSFYEQFLAISCKVGINDCIEHSVKLYNEWLACTEEDKKSLNEFIYLTAMRKTPEDKVIQEIETLTPEHDDFQTLVDVYLGFESEAIVKAVLDKLLTVEGKTVYVYELFNPTIKYHPEFVYNYYKEHASELLAKDMTYSFLRAITVYFANLPNPEPYLSTMASIYETHKTAFDDRTDYVYFNSLSEDVHKISKMVKPAIEWLKVHYYM